MRFDASKGRRSNASERVPRAGGRRARPCRPLCGFSWSLASPHSAVDERTAAISRARASRPSPRRSRPPRSSPPGTGPSTAPGLAEPADGDRLPLRRRRRSHPAPRRAPGERGSCAAVVHGIFGGGGGSPRWYQLAGGGRRRSTSAPRSAATSTRRSTEQSSRSAPSWSRQDVRLRDRHPAPDRPSVIVAATQLVSDPALTVGTAVVSGATKLGRVADLAAVEQQALARYTNDAGNVRDLEVRPAPVLSTG